MAWLEQDRPDGPYQLVFRFGTKRIKRSTRTKDRREAEEVALRVERRTKLVKAGELQIPAETDSVAFLMGQVVTPQNPQVLETPRLQEASKKYLESIPQKAIEENSRKTMQIHLNHLCRVVGNHRRISGLTTSALQEYISQRTERESINPETVKKEIVTAAGLWKFSVSQKWVEGTAPTQGLKYPKGREKPPFRTYDEIESLISTGGYSEIEEKELWDSLILTVGEVERMLDDVFRTARHPFLYPMIATAVHTGARKSELIRCEVRDIDLVNNFLTIREKKRSRSRQTTRRVPLSEKLREILSGWLNEHPGGRYAFCINYKMERSRSQKTGIRELTIDQAHDHFKRTLSRKWSNVKGWHVLRHSFASNCAASGVDQRVINEWMGHQTEEMVRRYRHLFPDQQRKAIALVFPSR